MPITRDILRGTLASLLLSGLAVAQESVQPVLPERSGPPGNVAPGPYPPGQFPQGPYGQFPQGPVPPGAYPQPGMFGPGGQPGARPAPNSDPQQYPEAPPPGMSPQGRPGYPQQPGYPQPGYPQQRGTGGPIMGSPFGGPEGAYGGTPMPPMRMRDSSLIYIGTPPNKGIREHDLVTVIIDEKSEVTQTSRFDRQRNTLFRAELREFIRLGTSGNLRPAALDQPKIDTQLRSQMNSYGNGRSNEGLKFRIQSTVVDVRPNGVLVLEARKTITTDTGIWVYTLSGSCRIQDIQANNSIVSENIADMKLSKLEQGKIRDSTDRGWLTLLYDKLLPF